MRGKSLVALLVLACLVVSSLTLMAISAQTSKPAVPEFIVKLVSHPYNLAPTTTIDPYTGREIITDHGGYFENKSIEITIKNQPYSPHIDASGNSTSLQYNLRYKGYFTSTWTYFPYNPDRDYKSTSYAKLYYASNSQYTIISMSAADFPRDAQIDFQIQALSGYSDKIYTSMWGQFPYGDLEHYYLFRGEASGWSPTQTLTIGSPATPASTWNPSTPTPTQHPITPQPTENQPSPTELPPLNLFDFGLSWEGAAIAVMAVVIAALAVGLVVFWRRVAAKT